jgi:hypothetical protein
MLTETSAELALRRMHGGTQSQLMRCSDGSLYVVKFQNNPQGCRVLANEMLGTLLAREMRLPVAGFAIVDVKETLIEMTDELVIQVAHGTKACQAGLSFGSRYQTWKGHPAISDQLITRSLSHFLLCMVSNLSDFAGMLVFDKWTCNSDGRQILFVLGERDSHYKAVMIDQGLCFHGSEWTFRDAPLYGIYEQPQVYERITGIKDFEPWLEFLECGITKNRMRQLAAKIPPEWYGHNQFALNALVDRLDWRRAFVRSLIWSTRRACPQYFPNWNAERSLAACG